MLTKRKLGVEDTWPKEEEERGIVKRWEDGKGLAIGKDEFTLRK